MTKKRIQLIEDDPLLSRMYERLFTIHGYDLLVDLDSQAGLERAKVEKPDLIMLDVMMPNLNGLEVLKLLKDDSATQSIPVVIISNVEDEDTQKQASALGAVGYIIKSKSDPDGVVEYIAQKIK